MLVDFTHDHSLIACSNKEPENGEAYFMSKSGERTGCLGCCHHEIDDNH